jgi:5'-3' exonuclease
VAGGLTVLVDAASLIYRAYFSTPDSVRAPDGRRINAARGFLGMLTRLIEDHDPDRICCAADDNWRPDWRVKLIETYKTHRTEAGSIQVQTDVEIDKQMPLMLEILDRAGVKTVGYPDHEAEDVIGTLAARSKGRVAIVSGDRDLFQLVRDPDVYVLYPKRGVSVVDRVNEGYIEDHYGIPGTAYLDFALLRGDTSDGLPGVKGIGEKIAASLVSKYGSIDGVIEAATSDGGGVALEKVRRDLDYLERAKKVVTIPTDLPIPDVDITRPRGVDTEEVEAVAEPYGLKNSATRLVTALNS